MDLCWPINKRSLLHITYRNTNGEGIISYFLIVQMVAKFQVGSVSLGLQYERVLFIRLLSLSHDKFELKLIFFIDVRSVKG